MDDFFRIKQLLNEQKLDEATDFIKVYRPIENIIPSILEHGKVLDDMLRKYPQHCATSEVAESILMLDEHKAFDIFIYHPNVDLNAVKMFDHAIAHRPSMIFNLLSSRQRIDTQGASLVNHICDDFVCIFGDKDCQLAKLVEKYRINPGPVRNKIREHLPLCKRQDAALVFGMSLLLQEQVFVLNK